MGSGSVGLYWKSVAPGRRTPSETGEAQGKKMGGRRRLAHRGGVGGTFGKTPILQKLETRLRQLHTHSCSHPLVVFITPALSFLSC